MFKCDKCGLCCQNLKLSSIYKVLDRGDGICLFYDESTKLCTIYEKRSVICNVDEVYKLYFFNKMEKSEYYKLNYEVCNQLKKSFNK
ncbi:MAG: YkgJ family cysteine cluster protein [Fusobacterium sp.]